MKFNPGNADQKILIYLFLIFLLDSFWKHQTAFDFLMSSREEEDAQKGELGRNEFRTGDTVILHVWNTRYKLNF